MWAGFGQVSRGRRRCRRYLAVAPIALPTKDVATHYFAFAVKLDAANALEEDFVAHAGFHADERFLVGIVGPRPCWTTYDRFEWQTGDTWGGKGTNETMFLVHGEIERRWDELVSGSLIDVSDFPHG